MIKDSIAIIGAGNGGITAAADLKQKGFIVSLYGNKKSEAKLSEIKKQGGVHLEDENGSNFYEIDLVTTDIEEAIKDCELIMLTVPGFAIENIAETLAPVVLESQAILINGASTLSSLRFVKTAEKLGIKKKFLIEETNSLTYGTRAFPREARAELSLRVNKIFVSAYPKENTGKLLDIANKYYSCFVPAENIWHTTLENGNPEVHPGPTLLNVGRIDYSKGDFYLYKEGITEHTIKLLRAIESERIQIGKALGFELENASESRYNRGYFTNNTDDLQTLFNKSPVFTQIKGPESINSRYFTEDISDGLVLWSNLGKVTKIPTPNIDSVIQIGNTILDTNFFETGLTLEKLELENKSTEELIKLV